MSLLRHAVVPLLMLILYCASVLAVAQTSIPILIMEQEGTFTGTWSQGAGGVRATWSNGAVATLTVQSFISASVRIFRTDLQNTTSAGLTAIYSGQISESGDSIVNGEVTWTWPGHAGYPASDTWTASWTALSKQPAADQPIEPANHASTRDFTDRALFEAAISGPSKTIGFGGILQGADFTSFDHGPLVVSGVTFSTSTPHTFVNVTSASHYSSGAYLDDFIVNSDNSSPNNELKIALSCPTRAVGMDFGGLGSNRLSSASITLSNGHIYNQTTLPTVGHAAFVGFVSADPISSLVLYTVNDSWVLEDVVVADCQAAGQTATVTSTGTAPSPTPEAAKNAVTPMAGFRQAIWTRMSSLAGSGNEGFKDDCAVDSNTWDPGTPVPPLIAALAYQNSYGLNWLVNQDGIWNPLDATFESASTFLHFGGMFFPDFSQPKTSYHLTLSREGTFTVTETGSADSFSPIGYFYRQLKGNATWSASQIVDLNSGKGTIIFEADLTAQYIGGAQPNTGKPLGVPTTCKINAHYSGKYNAVDMIRFAQAPASCGPSNILAPPLDTKPICGDPTLPFNYIDNQYFHNYNDITEVCSKKQSSDCTVDNVFNILLRTPAAIAPVVSSVQKSDIASCHVLQLVNCGKYDNKIRIVIDLPHHSVINYTLPTHIFYPGQVTRQVIDEQGTIEIKTIGTGVGCYELLNEEGGTCKIWPDADQQLRVAVWKALGLGPAPDISVPSHVCRFIMTLGAVGCDIL